MSHAVNMYNVHIIWALLFWFPLTLRWLNIYCAFFSRLLQNSVISSKCAFCLIAHAVFIWKIAVSVVVVVFLVTSTDTYDYNT